MMKHTAKIFLALLSTVGTLSAGTAQAETKLKMMYTAVSGFAAGYVAQEQGFFKKRGIDVEFVQTMSSGNNPPALVSGSVQIAGPTLPTLLQANDAGLDLVVIASGAVYPARSRHPRRAPGQRHQKPEGLEGQDCWRSRSRRIAALHADPKPQE